MTGGGRLNSRLGFLGVRGAIFSTSSALAIVDGIGSHWTSTEQLFVGYEGQGTLAVTAGGQVTSGTGHLGFTNAGAGTVRVSGAGSRWTNTESLYVGVAGTGDLLGSERRAVRGGLAGLGRGAVVMALGQDVAGGGPNLRRPRTAQGQAV